MVIPKRIRDELGLGAGEVELVRDGAGLRIEPIPGAGWKSGAAADLR